MNAYRDSETFKLIQNVGEELLFESRHNGKTLLNRAKRKSHINFKLNLLKVNVTGDCANTIAITKYRNALRHMC